MKKILALAFALLASPAFADSTINNLGAGAAVQSTDILPAYQGANPATGVTAAQIKTFANTSAVNAQVGTTYAIATSDQGKLVTFSNGSSIAVSIAQATSGTFFNGWAVSLKNLGAGTVTVTPTTSTVDGSASFTLTTGQGVDLYSDGSNYFTQPGKAGGSGTVTTTGSPANGNLSKFSGATSITNGDLSADCVTSGTLAVTCGYKTAGFVANNWYVPQTGITSVGAQSGTQTASSISCVFGSIPNKVTIGAIGAAVSTLAASGNFQFAIYSNVNTRPGSLIGNTGSISTAAVGTITGAMAANKQVGPGGADGSSDVWWCSNVDASAGGTAKFISSVNTASLQGVNNLIGSTTAANALSRFGAGIAGVSCAGANCNGGSSTFNTWPASLAGSTWTEVNTTNMPIPVFQAASVP